jgi:hypothetical protein
VCGGEREREREIFTAGEAFCGRASIPVPILVPIIRATAPATVPFFPVTLAGSSLSSTGTFFAFVTKGLSVVISRRSCCHLQAQAR